MQKAVENNVKNPALKLHTCKTLNIAGFKECYCFQNFHVLIIDGEPGLGDLVNAWNDIIFEYGCLIKTENSVYVFDLQKRIAELVHHISFVDMAIELLRRRFSQPVVDELIELGYDEIYNFDDCDKYSRQLDRIKSLCKTRIMDLHELQDEYQKYTMSSGTESPSEEAFEEWMSELCRFQHYNIDREATTVVQWTGIINSFIRHRKANNPQPTDG